MNVLSNVKRFPRLLIINLLLQFVAYTLIYTFLVSMNILYMLQSTFMKILNKIWIQQILVTLVLGSVCSILFYFMLCASEIESEGRYLSNERFYQKAEQHDSEIVISYSNLNKRTNVQKCKNINEHECAESY